MRIRHAVTAALIAVTLSIRTTGAIERFLVIPLPDDGAGSHAAARFPTTAGGEAVYYIVGSKTTPGGLEVPVVWLVDNNSNSATAEALPIPSGVEAEAVGGARFPSGDLVVVGNVHAAGGWDPIFWRKPFMGGWSMPQIVAGPSGARMARADYCGDGIPRLRAAGSVPIGGVQRPVVHTITETTVASQLLPGPAGRAGAANVIDCEGFAFVAGGWMADAQGRMRAVVWQSNGVDSTIAPVPLPNGAVAQTNGAQFFESSWSTCGAVLRSNRTRGFTYDSLGNLGLLPPLPGFQSARCEHLGDTATQEFGHFGTSSDPVVGDNETPAELATGWINGDPFPVQQLLMDPGSVSSVRAYNQGVGEIVATAGSAPQAAAFTATTLVPDAVEVLIGRPDGFAALSNASKLWHDDGQALHVRTERSGGQRRALVELTFRSIVARVETSTNDWAVVARLQSSPQSAIGTLNVYQYNYVSMAFMLVGSAQVTGVDETITGTLPGPASQWMDPQTRQMRSRIEVGSDANGNGALLIDHASLGGQ